MRPDGRLVRRRSGLHPYAFPERHPARDLLRRLLRRRVVPARIAVHAPAGGDVVIARDALPRAGGVRGALSHVLATQGLRREVVVAFHHLRAIARGDDLAIPNRSGHRVLLLRVLVVVRGGQRHPRDCAGGFVDARSAPVAGAAGWPSAGAQADLRSGCRSTVREPRARPVSRGSALSRKRRPLAARPAVLRGERFSAARQGNARKVIPSTAGGPPRRPLGADVRTGPRTELRPPWRAGPGWRPAPPAC